MKACPLCALRYPAEATYCFADGAILTAFHDARIGATIAGQYVLEERIGEGGMAVVYRARHKLVDRPCAIKVMNHAFASDESTRERFRREAKSAQSLAHPNVIEIFDQGDTDDGTPFIVMELLEGCTLSVLVDRGPMDLLRAIPLMVQIARGMARAHDLGVVHRDLKPDNIFICRRADGYDLVKILDFGIARSRTDSRLTTAGQIFGTPEYMAPERILTSDAGPSVDLYAAGVIFFEMATGRLPFEAPDPTAFLVKHLRDAPLRARVANPRVPPRFDALIAALLEKDPKARPVDAHRVEQDLIGLARALGAPIPPEPEEDPASVRARARSIAPGVVVDPWRRRIAIFERMFSTAYAKEAPRPQLERLSQLRALVDEFAGVRDDSAREQRALDDVDSEGRDGRLRLGFAVDATGLDASKAKDELRVAQAQAERLKSAGEEAARAYTAALQELIAWEGRCAHNEPYVQLAEAHRACAIAIEVWLGARKAEREADSSVDSRERGVKDLDYQLTELRAALAKHEQRCGERRDAAQRRLVELGARAERLEQRLLQISTLFCEPLRDRSDLGELFGALDSRRLDEAGQAR
jgi:serine/threonine-protein kinase